MSNVIELGDDNFQKVISANDIALIHFYAPWSGHCKRLAPELEAAAAVLKDNDPPVPTFKVNGTDSGKETCSKYGVYGYPTLKIFRNGEFSQDYLGPRDRDGITAYMKKNAGPSSMTIKNVAHFETKLKTVEEPLIAYFSKEEDDGYKNFLKVAEQLRMSHIFCHDISGELANHFGITSPSVVVFNTYNGTRHLMSSDFTGSSIRSFVNLHALPYVYDTQREMSESGYQGEDYNEERFSYGVTNHLLFVGTPASRAAVLPILRAFGEKHQGDILPFYIDRLDKNNLVKRMVSNAEEEISIWIMDNSTPNERIKFKMEDGNKVPTLEELDLFIKGWKAKTLTPYYMSAPEPETQDGYAYELVAKTYQSMVMSKEKDTLIAFYASWDGHWKTLKLTWEELAKTLAEEDSILIGQIDCITNDVPLNIEGFPTIYFCPKNGVPKRYEGGRSLEDFTNYLKREASQPLTFSDDRKKKRKKKREL